MKEPTWWTPLPPASPRREEMLPASAPLEPAPPPKAPRRGRKVVAVVALLALALVAGALFGRLTSTSNIPALAFLTSESRQAASPSVAAPTSAPAAAGNA